MEREFKGVFIPAEIWNDENLSITERVLFAEIDSFSRNGECFASNGHFARLLKVSTRQIQNYLKSLKEKGYINTTFIYKNNSKEIEKRIITPLFGYGKKLHDPTVEMTGGDVQPCTPSYVESYTPPHVETCADNNSFITNTFINNPINNTKTKKTNKKEISSSELEREFEQLWKVYPRKMGKAKARSSFIKARKKDKIPYEIIENGIYRYIDYLELLGTEEQYIMHGSTWFGQMKWQDEYTTTGLNRKPKNATEYLKAKYGGNPHGSYGNRKIIEYDSEVISESF